MVETGIAAETVVVRLLAMVTGAAAASGNLTGNVTYFMEQPPEEEKPIINGSLANLVDWFRVDSRTGEVRLLKEPANSWALTGGNVSFIVGARDASRSIEARASVVIIIHSLSSITFLKSIFFFTLFKRKIIIYLTD